MGLLKTAVLTFALALFTFIVLTFIGALADAAPAEVAGTAGVLSGTAETLRPAMPLEYAWIVLVAAVGIVGVHALFRRQTQGQV